MCGRRRERRFEFSVLFTFRTQRNHRRHHWSSTFSSVFCELSVRDASVEEKMSLTQNWWSNKFHAEWKSIESNCHRDGRPSIVFIRSMFILVVLSIAYLSRCDFWIGWMRVPSKMNCSSTMSRRHWRSKPNRKGNVFSFTIFTRLFLWWQQRHILRNWRTATTRNKRFAIIWFSFLLFSVAQNFIRLSQCEKWLANVSLFLFMRLNLRLIKNTVQTLA